MPDPARCSHSTAMRIRKCFMLTIWAGVPDCCRVPPLPLVPFPKCRRDPSCWRRVHSDGAQSAADALPGASSWVCSSWPRPHLASGVLCRHPLTLWCWCAPQGRGDLPAGMDFLPVYVSAFVDRLLEVRGRATHHLLHCSVAVVRGKPLASCCRPRLDCWLRR